nr:hypothetical protein [uncultured Hyphomonas sp.]
MYGQKSEFAAALKFLSQEHKPDCLLHIGAGRVQLNWMHTELGAVSGLLVDPDVSRTEWLNSVFRNQASVHVRDAVLSAKRGTARFYRTNLRSENGLMPPVALRDYWKNIRRTDVQDLPTQTLAELLDGDPQLAKLQSRINWAVFDSLPAMSAIMAVGDDVFDQLSVVVTRSLKGLGESGEVDAMLSECRRETLVAFMEARDFVVLTSVSDGHPDFVLDVFVRDWKRRHESALAEQSQKYESALAEQSQKYESALAEQSQKYESALAEQSQKYESALAEQAQKYESALAEQSRKHETALAEQLQKVETGEISSLRGKLEAAEETCSLARKEASLAQNNLNALRVKYAELSDSQMKLEQFVEAVEADLSDFSSLFGSGSQKKEKKTDE